MTEQLPEIPAKHVSQRQQAHAMSLFKLKAKELAKMQAFTDAGGFDDVIAALAGGMTQKAIAASIAHVDGSTLSIWLSSLEGAQRTAVDLARRAGAQACLDKSLDVLDEADQELSGSVQIAIAKSKAWGHRAAVFDRRLHDKGELPTQQNKRSCNPSVFQLVIMPGSNATAQLNITPAQPDDALI